MQERAVTQLSALAVDNPIRAIALELLYKLQSGLAVNQEQQLEAEDRELVMAIAPLFQQKLEAAKQEGRQEGIQEGQRSILESFFLVRFGELDALPATEFTMLFLQLSALTVDEQGMQQARQLLAENVVRMRFGEIGDTADATLRDRLRVMMQNLLALPPEELTLLLQQLPQLSNEELLARLSN